MAKKATIKADSMYRVDLTKAIKVGRRQVLPGPETKLRGDVLTGQLEADPESVNGYEEIEDPTGE